MHIRCPNDHVLEAPESHAGKRVQCPACKAIIVVPAPVADPPPVMVARVVKEPPGEARATPVAEYEDEHWPDARAAQREALLKVKTGLGYHVIKIYVAVVGAFVLVIAFFVWGAMLVHEGRKDPGRFLNARKGEVVRMSMPLVALLVLYDLGVGALGLIGSAHCTFIPKQSMARPSIMAALVADTVLVVVGLFAAFYQMSFGRSPVLEWLVLFARITSYFAFFIFLRRLAFYKKKRWLADEAFSVMWFAFAVVGAYLAGSFLMAGFRAELRQSADLFTLAIGLGMLSVLAIWLIRYVKLLNDFRAVLP
jgi:hypothetical protein